MKKIVLILAAVAIGLSSFASSAFAVDQERVERLKEKGTQLRVKSDNRMKRNPDKVTKALKNRVKKKGRKALDKTMKNSNATRRQVKKAHREVDRALEEGLIKSASPR